MFFGRVGAYAHEKTEEEQREQKNEELKSSIFQFAQAKITHDRHIKVSIYYYSILFCVSN
jgi:hypothetical protein